MKHPQHSVATRTAAPSASRPSGEKSRHSGDDPHPPAPPPHIHGKIEHVVAQCVAMLRSLHAKSDREMALSLIIANLRHAHELDSPGRIVELVMHQCNMSAAALDQRRF